MLDPIPPEGWPEDLADLRQGFAGRLNVYGLMAHHPALLRGWAGFRAHVVVETALTPQHSEVVILRCGHRLGSDYEWAHHVSRGRKVGLTDARILSLRGPVEAMAEDDRILCIAVDQLFDRRGLDPATQQALAALTGVRGMLDLMATVAHYSLLGFLLNSFGAPLDADVAAELAANPIG
ncbi:carboxymuconolactone decarboxylase family protein [Neotabrizicola sp. VNH66]|uniref:carboxymuconolactone decarboxylase family protein n=1 Tax=Neotabrizicola sp. VNH66 TaxID=3400918 RepID=UPI003C0774AF